MMMEGGAVNCGGNEDIKKGDREVVVEGQKNIGGGGGSCNEDKVSDHEPLVMAVAASAGLALGYPVKHRALSGSESVQCQNHKLVSSTINFPRVRCQAHHHNNHALSSPIYGNPCHKVATVDVNLGENHHYPIYIGSGVISSPYYLQKHVDSNMTVLIVTNTTVAPLYLDKVVHAFTFGNPNILVETFVLPEGEVYKTRSTVVEICEKINTSQMYIGSTIVALGGGVICDLVGHAAVTYNRRYPLNFIHIPTTLMAQVDLPINGQLSVHFETGKHMLSVPYKPQCVLIDTNTLNTLPNREFNQGIVQFAKYGLTRDAEFFEWLEYSITGVLKRHPRVMAYGLERSCKIKAEVVSQDEKEDGLMETLTLGHNFAHAIDAWFSNGLWLHGETIAVGMVMAVDLSFRLGWIEESVMNRIIDIFFKARLPTIPPEGTMTVDMFHWHMGVQKAVAADGALKLALLKGPLGNCVFTTDYNSKALHDTVYDFCEGLHIKNQKKYNTVTVVKGKKL
ncbi:3-dehydroquinate synthase [Thalictrum thalictroides]|uniref:3-dehydroquinate synthase n=1 Tax=Thalictrum thalictroides TaxID=46969 RepID=A0A7J6VP63_THATH|nr:3-dehydroquinate synthase [Thalictrum thalictroides]